MIKENLLKDAAHTQIGSERLSIIWLTKADHPGKLAPLEIVCQLQRAGFLLNSWRTARTAHQTNHLKVFKKSVSKCEFLDCQLLE